MDELIALLEAAWPEPPTTEEERDQYRAVFARLGPEDAHTELMRRIGEDRQERPPAALFRQTHFRAPGRSHATEAEEPANDLIDLLEAAWPEPPMTEEKRAEYRSALDALGPERVQEEVARLIGEDRATRPSPNVFIALAHTALPVAREAIHEEPVDEPQAEGITGDNWPEIEALLHGAWPADSWDDKRRRIYVSTLASFGVAEVEEAVLSLASENREHTPSPGVIANRVPARHEPPVPVDRGPVATPMSSNGIDAPVGLQLAVRPTPQSSSSGALILAIVFGVAAVASALIGYLIWASTVSCYTPANGQTMAGLCPYSGPGWQTQHNYLVAAIAVIAVVAFGVLAYVMLGIHEDVPLAVELRDGGPGLMFRQARA